MVKILRVKGSPGQEWLLNFGLFHGEMVNSMVNDAKLIIVAMLVTPFYIQGMRSGPIPNGGVGRVVALL